jgi:hypothetical protein
MLTTINHGMLSEISRGQICPPMETASSHTLQWQCQTIVLSQMTLFSHTAITTLLKKPICVLGKAQQYNQIGGQNEFYDKI